MLAFFRKLVWWGILIPLAACDPWDTDLNTRLSASAPQVDILTGLTVLSNSKVLAVGASTLSDGVSHLVVARFTSLGEFDTSFGSGGKLTFDFSGYTGASATAVTELATGQILIAGQLKSGGFYRPTLFRLNSDGTLDSSFGTGGYSDLVTTLAGLNNANSIAFKLQTDGKIVLLANTGVTRTDSLGNVDTGFATGGLFVPATCGANGVRMFTLALQDDGKVLAAGSCDVDPTLSSDFDTRVYRLGANGVLDPTFATGGTFSQGLSNGGDESVREIVVQSDGKIILGGNNEESGEMVVQRLDSAGAVDTSFGTNGFSRVNFATSTIAFFRRFVFNTDGSFYGVATINPMNFERRASIGTARFLANGTVDSSYGTSGLVTALTNESCPDSSVSLLGTTAFSLATRILYFGGYACASQRIRFMLGALWY